MAVVQIGFEKGDIDQRDAPSEELERLDGRIILYHIYISHFAFLYRNNIHF